MNQSTWIAIGVALVVAIVAFFFIIKNTKTKPSKVTKSNVDLDRLFVALGGKENIRSSEANGSKVVFNLHNTKIIVQEDLKALGASGIVVSKDKVTVIFGKSSEALVNEIKQVQ